MPLMVWMALALMAIAAPAVPQPDAKDRLSDDARVVSNRRRYLLEVDLRISNHSERPFCVPNFDVRSTNSSSDHSRSVTLAAIAGVTRNDCARSVRGLRVPVDPGQRTGRGLGSVSV